MRQYLDAVVDVLENGTRKENRTGVDTISTFNINYEIDLRKGFPLLTTKKISWKNIVIENLWFLSGTNDPEFLHKHNVKFWDPWLDENGMAPDSYGPQWRNQFCRDDQIKYVLEQLKTNPMSRRMVVSAWNPDSAQKSRLPPCHLMWIVNVQNLVNLEDIVPYQYSMPGEYEVTPSLCCHLSQRSADIALGVPYNIAGYGFLMHLFSRFSGIPVGIFGHTLVDAHIYTDKPDGSMQEYDHVPGLVEQIKREPRKLPRLKISDKIQKLSDVENLITSNASTQEILDLFQLEGYNPHPAIKFKVAV